MNSLSGPQMEAYWLKNDHAQVALSAFGARILDVATRDYRGEMDRVSVGANRATFTQPEGDPFYRGCTVGRYANRIAESKFAIDGKEYTLEHNNGVNCLHGGKEGFDRRWWKARPFQFEKSNGIEYSLESPDGDQGFPGKLDALVRYLLTGNRLIVEYEAATTHPTHVNLTNHAYWNLNGTGKGDILNHDLFVAAQQTTEIGRGLIPTGRLTDVAGTPLDFRAMRPIRTAIDAFLADPELKGIDHNFVINGGESSVLSPNMVAAIRSPLSGRRIDMYSTYPGVQVYADNWGDPAFQGIAIEPQFWPNSPNIPEFPSTLLMPGSIYRHAIEFRFIAGDPLE